nr:Hsp70 family protein [Actinomycetota bacterium]
MGYALGVDLGTAYTAAATYRDGKAEIATLGNRAAAIPSVVLLREDEEVLTGDAANRRGVTEPDRVAREFKRRVGDTTPIFLGGSPYSAETLMGKLLRSVVDEVSTREGGPPDRIAVTHPANWGPFKKDLLNQAITVADLSNVETLTEPQAAAIHYSDNERVDPGDVVAVYDLGGGTFDAAVLRKTATGFEILGQPEGIERLGGIDFDAAVFQHVARSLGGALENLDEDDLTAMAAVARLRQECVDAKEALSSDTDASIPVLLPDLQTEVRLTRTEFEGMVRPALVDTITALRRALRSADVEPDQVKTVLLVGGSSRIPLVAQMVGAELGRPVAVDAHPKHSIALGAALAAGGETDKSGAGAAAAKT